MDHNKNNDQNPSTQSSENTSKTNSDIIQGNYIKRKVYPGIYTN